MQGVVTDMSASIGSLPLLTVLRKTRGPASHVYGDHRFGQLKQAKGVGRVYKTPVVDAIA
jgi:hypothetical protein